MMNTDMVSYYKDRAAEYERIYAKPERQPDLIKAASILQNHFARKEVLEIACGTGYWTEKIASTAKTILATDINETVLKIARQKSFPTTAVSFEAADMYALSTGKKYESLFGGFIWSHIPLQELEQFINTVNKLTAPGGTIVFIDNNYVPESSSPITGTDEFNNTYQLRKLENGTEHQVIKNFPEEKFVRNLLQGKAAAIEFINLQYYWILKYRNI